MTPRITYYPMGNITTTPTSINFSPGEAQAIQCLSIKEALEKFGMTQWTHTLWVKNQSKLNHQDSSTLTTLISQSIATESKMAITPMQAPFPGYGVIATEFIRKGSVIIYSGQRIDKLTDIDPYALGCAKFNTIMTARDYGNMGRFLNHAPTAINFGNTVQVQPEAELTNDEVALANFKEETLPIGEHYLSLLVALRDIAPGEPLYWDYGIYDYFNQPTLPSPYLLTKKGDVLPQEWLHWKNPRVAFYKNGGRFDVSISEIIEEESHVLTSNIDESEPSLCLFINYTYFTRDPLFNKRLTQQLYTFILLPEEATPDIKFVTEKSFSKAPSTSIMYLQEILGEAFQEDEWLTRNVPHISLGLEPSYINCLYFIGDDTKKELIRNKFNEARLVTEDIEGKLSIRRSELAVLLPNCSSYNLKKAMSIYKPNQPYKWRGNDNMYPPRVWLELGSTAEDRELLSQLVDHIKLSLITENEKKSVFLSQNNTTKNYLLMISDARIITRNKVAALSADVMSEAVEPESIEHTTSSMVR